MHFSRSASPHISSSFQWISCVDAHDTRGILNCITAAWWYPLESLVGMRESGLLLVLWEVAQLFCLETCPWASRLLPFASACTWDLHFHSVTTQRNLQKTLLTQAGNSFPWAKNNSGKLQEHDEQQCSPWPSERACYSMGQRKQGKETERHFHR